MMKTSLILLFALVAVGTITAHHDDDDKYSPLIKLLKQLRRRDRYSAYSRDEDSANKGTDQSNLSSASSSSDPVITSEFLGQRPQSSSNSNSNSNSGNSNSNQFSLDSFSSPEQIQKIIRQSQQQGSSSSSSSSGSSGGSSGGSYQPIGGTSLPPQRIEQINRGVSTILNGVGSGSLERILRGSFMFTRNENVRSVANNVLDSIFGQRVGGNSPN